MTSFGDLLSEAMRGAPRFGHREHVHLTWLAVRRHGTTAAIDLVSAGIRETSRYAGAPQKYHATVSRAWVECVSHHVEHDTVDDFAQFVHHSPALLDKRLLSRFYRSTTLAAPAARTGWVAPDLQSFPWTSKPD